jgi:hypothetical protein
MSSHGICITPTLFEKMASCFIKNPSAFTLKVCNGVGIVFGLVGLPYLAYKTSEFVVPPTAKVITKGVDRTVGQIHFKNEKIKTVTDTFEKGVERVQNRIKLVGDSVVSSPLKLGSFELVIGGIITGSSVLYNIGYYELGKVEFRTNKMIQTVCCHRIRFFMLRASGHGFVTGIMIPGLFLMFSGGVDIVKGIKEKSSI